MAFDAFGEGRTRRPVRCVIYTRQSVGSSDELSSCAIQREACAVFAAAQGWSVVDEAFDDVGFSGATLDRPGLQKLLAFVRQVGADRILIHRLDRLSRNVRDCVGLLDEFRRLKLDLVIVTAPELGHAAQDHFLLNIMASFAEFEREMIAGRIAEARAALKTQARRIAGAVPFGYDADARTKQLVPGRNHSMDVRRSRCRKAAR
ncbi:MAG: recombinase family protein [Bryobacterales bacterium]|nr:recombinase family protein [Bryobacterales bacterium]